MDDTKVILDKHFWATTLNELKYTPYFPVRWTIDVEEFNLVAKYFLHFTYLQDCGLCEFAVYADEKSGLGKNGEPFKHGRDQGDVVIENLETGEVLTKSWFEFVKDCCDFDKKNRWWFVREEHHDKQYISYKNNIIFEATITSLGLSYLSQGQGLHGEIRTLLTPSRR